MGAWVCGCVGARVSGRVSVWEQVGACWCVVARARRACIRFGGWSCGSVGVSGRELWARGRVGV